MFVHHGLSRKQIGTLKGDFNEGPMHTKVIHVAIVNSFSYWVWSPTWCLHESNMIDTEFSYIIFKAKVKHCPIKYIYIYSIKLIQIFPGKDGELILAN